jgi:hypothetical protein
MGSVRNRCHVDNRRIRPAKCRRYVYNVRRGAAAARIVTAKFVAVMEALVCHLP